MQPSSPSSRGNSRVGSVKYAHSPYVYRTTVDDAPVSPMSDHGRSEPGSVPQYHSPRSLSQSTGNADGTGAGTGGSQVDLHSQPNSPLGRSTTTSNQEYSQPIQVGSAPNVHARYRRGIQSPMSRPGNDSGNRSAFPSSPAGSLPPRSSFMAREDSTGTFSTGGESAPVRGGLNNPYRLPSAAGLSAPQYTMPLSSSYRGGNGSGVAAASGGGGGGGGGSGSHHSSPLHGRQHSGSMAPVSPAFLPRPTSPSSGPSAAPAYGSSTANNANSNTNNSYAPTGFSMPPTMATAGSGSYHGPPSGRAGSHSASYVDSRSSHPSSPLLGANGRPLAGSSSYPREPVSPTHLYNSGTYGGPVGPDGTPYSPSSNSRGSNGAQPPAFATAVQHQQQLQQQHPNGSFGLGSFPGRRSAPPGHSSSPFTSHMSLHTAGNDTALMSESYGTNTKTLSTMADDTMSSSGKSGSSASSIRDDLPLCPNDDACTTINDRKHQKKYAHTCRLFPCYHGHVTRHAKLFRHAPGQISLPEGLSANTKVSSHALASVNFSTISPEAPNAYRIYVSHGDKSYEIFGDWASVKVHTFKRYLHQVYHIAPGCQILSVQKTGKVMDDDINTVKCYGIEEDSVIQLRSDSEDAQAPGRLRIPLDDL